MSKEQITERLERRACWSSDAVYVLNWPQLFLKGEKFVSTSELFISFINFMWIIFVSIFFPVSINYAMRSVVAYNS